MLCQGKALPGDLSSEGTMAGSHSECVTSQLQGGSVFVGRFDWGTLPFGTIAGLTTLNVDFLRLASGVPLLLALHSLPRLVSWLDGKLQMTGCVAGVTGDKPPNVVVHIGASHQLTLTYSLPLSAICLAGLCSDLWVIKEWRSLKVLISVCQGSRLDAL